jgi:DNA polymerase-3 subunit alpha
VSSGFVHLHVHTEYSLSDGIVKIKPLVKACAAAQMPAVAITDQGNLFAMVKFYKAALGAGLKPIVGADIWVEDLNAPEGRGRLLLLCRNLDGYRALSRLLTRGYSEGQQNDVPVVRREWIKADHEGLIALSGAREGDIGRALLAGDMELARRRLAYWRGLFGDGFYLELQRTGRAGDEDHVHAAVALAAAEGAPVVATNDVRFLKREDFEAHEARVCIHDGRTLDDPRRQRLYSEEQYLRTPQEMAELFKDIPEALENTVEIARRCNLVMTLGEPVLPEFPLPPGMTIDEYLRQRSHQGLDERLKILLPAELPDREAQVARYRERLDIELGVILQMGFPGYFLIVADFIQWAKDNDIPVGPGRGSGAGSLVAYALKITDLDPLRYDLLFERFLNPERVSMPDFDVDFCMEKRDRVIDYVAAKYGREKVSQIATHGTMAAKAVVRDVGRVFGHPYGFVDRIAKLIPLELGITLAGALEQEEELKTLYQDDEDVRTLLDMAMKLEGMARNVGKHAGGVVIAPTELTDFSPLYCEDGGGGLATQFDKDDVEAVGLVKFDFLGLRTLTIIDWAVKAINETRAAAGEEPLDITLIPLEDQASFKLLKAHQTTAVFQLESRGMKDLIKRLQPDSFEDIVALVALFRPGPLQSGMVDDFIERKHGKREVAYPTPELHHDDLKPILKPTYGVIVYQEQVMQIAQVLGGYTLGGADLLRRAMGKKKPEEMAKQRVLFVDGAAKRGISAEQAGGIFDLMEKFAGYGFNKSHSAAYALVSYQTAWLKAHYPSYFMAAVLSSDMDNTDKVVPLIEECRQMKLKVLPPSINASDYMFRAQDVRTIVYGLGAVKGVGQGAIEAMLEERARGGEFENLFDFCRRVDLKRINRRVLEALIRAGCFDCLGLTRATCTAQLPMALQAADQQLRDVAVGQEDLFGLGGSSGSDESVVPPDAPVLPEWDELERLAYEKEVLGLYLTGHPISRYESELGKLVGSRLNGLAATGSEPPPPQKGRRRNNGPKITVAGLVVGLRTRNTQSGSRMAILTLDDRTGRIEAIVFPEAFKQYRHVLSQDAVLVVEGTLDYDDFAGGNRVTVEKVSPIDEARIALAKRLVIKLDEGRVNEDLLGRVQSALETFRGDCPVLVEYRNGQAKAALRLDGQWRVRPSEDLVKRLTGLTDAAAIRIEY